MPAGTEADRGYRRGRFAVLFLVLTVNAGALKETPLLRWFPVDLTGLGAALVWVILIARWVSGRPRLAGTGSGLIVLWLSFIPGAAIAYWDGLDPYKVLLLFTVTLCCVLGPFFIVDTPELLNFWFLAQVWVSALVATAMYLFPAVESAGNAGRLNLEGSTSISIAQILGGGALVCINYALLARGRRRLVWWIVSLFLAISMVLIGSRGPFVSFIAASIAVVACVRLFRGRRLRVLLTLGAGLAPVFLYLFSQTGAATDRLAAVLLGESQYAGRGLLSGIALDTIRTAPGGLGWGGYSQLDAVRYTFGSESVYPHNIVLEIGAEGGWIALAGFVGVVLFVLTRGIISSAEPAMALSFALAVYWGMCAMFSSDVNGNRMWWASLAVVSAWSVRDRITTRVDQLTGEPMHVRVRGPR